MLETVAKGFKAARNKLKGRTEITSEVVDDALRDIRVALLEADVSFEVVKRFVARVREKAVEGAKAADEAVHEHPYQAIGIALGVGAILGYIIARRCSRNCD